MARQLLVISAPSGTGKSTVCRRLLETRPDVGVSISYTTRPPRGGEREGVEYYFVDRQRFERMVAEGQFIEWAEVHGERYGTARAEVERILAADRDVLLDIDVQGGLQIRKNFSASLLLFLLPPSFAELMRRLRGRATENEQQILKRLHTATGELEVCRAYEFFVVNDRLERAVAEVDEIRRGQRIRMHPPEDLIEELQKNIRQYLGKNAKKIS